MKATLIEYGIQGLELYPLVIGEKRYLVDKNGLIEHPELFKAICNGYNIDLSETTNEKGESKFIDI